MLRPARQRERFEQILSLLEDVYGDVTSEAVLRKRFFSCYQKENESLSQYANSLRELMAALEKKEVAGAASFTNTELVMRDQFLLGMRSQPLRRTLRERVKLDPHLTLQQVLKEAITLEREEECEATPGATQIQVTRGCSVDLCPVDGTRVQKRRFCKEQEKEVIQCERSEELIRGRSVAVPVCSWLRYKPLLGTKERKYCAQNSGGEHQKRTVCR
ncbi:hypothetical protein GDO81_023217 [Engystomops pustulosus]|uniref:Paraneoplastic antigen Ma-like C-terminal domain-containing protein n=1 Tax=Engystomops pustulosus TaxID=76066 RepID=A0AAV6ZHS8_ENGPU|nr:hypothetical protein GDO81_023217 [Engystomops pustulosus]